MSMNDLNAISQREWEGFINVLVKIAEATEGSDATQVLREIWHKSQLGGWDESLDDVTFRIRLVESGFFKLETVTNDR